IRNQFPHAACHVLGKADVDFLIAGCGTGRQAIETASWFPGARVLAVDLNLANLAYAKRKAEEAGLGGIEYAQADILGLGSIDRRFDVVDAVGGLHDLADPAHGWRVLLSLLRPAGFMRIGLYRRSMREDIGAARALIA